MDWQTIANIVPVIGIIISSIMLIIITWQAILIRKQMKSDHERSRREKAVNLLLKWTEKLDENTSIAKKIDKKLNEEQARKIYNYEEVRLSKDYKDLLNKIFKKVQEEGDSIILKKHQSKKLRWLLISYLNLLESILSAWQYSIVDRDLIEHEFSYLFSPEEGHTALKNFRIVCGGERTYPAIEIFINHLEEERKKILREKAKIL